MCETDVTDHNFVMLGISLIKPKNKQPTKTKSKTNLEQLLTDLANTDWEQILFKEHSDVNKLVNIFTQILLQKIENNTEQVVIPRSKRIINPGSHLG